MQENALEIVVCQNSGHFVQRGMSYREAFVIIRWPESFFNVTGSTGKMLWLIVGDMYGNPKHFSIHMSYPALDCF